MSLNERQRMMINRLLDGFEGKLTTSKWAALAKSSQDTALRDILQLVEAGVLLRNPEGGRSTSYSLAKFDGASCAARVDRSSRGARSRVGQEVPQPRLRVRR